jgi:hypothetical protein
MVRGTFPFLSGRSLLVTSLACLTLAVAGQARANDDELRHDVAAHLSAGELGLARNLAATAPEHIRGELLQNVAAAHSAAGEFDIARAITSKLPADNQGEMGAAIAESEALGGGVVIDFQAIIDLIQAQTSGEWVELDGIGGEIDPFQAGVRVDPLGRLSMARTDETGRVADVANQARAAAINEDMAQPSPLRMVSLTRLEREVADRLARGEEVVESMQQLAGLSEVQYVFFYPESQEVVIAGPAEGWSYNEQGQPIGTSSGRPTLQLDDLVTLLRVFSPEGNRIFGCSIDPRAEGLERLQQVVADSQQRGPLRPGQYGRWAASLGEALGAQDVTIQGIPRDSRIARVIVEADYRMKLIGLERVQGGPGIPSYFDLLADQPQAQGGIEGMRWWLTLSYDAVVHSPERDAFELGGSAVLCQSENEFLTAEGERVQTGQSEPVNREFAANFTEHYNELAEREPVFADLQGIFNLALVAAVIDREQAGQWLGETFKTTGAYSPARYWTPREADTVVNHRVYNGRDIVVQVAGGVEANVLAALDEAQVEKADPNLDNVADRATAPTLPAGRWWWDAPAAE